MASNLELMSKEVEPYFFESYGRIARLMGVDDSIEEKDWFIYSGIEGYLAHKAMEDPDFIGENKIVQERDKAIVSGVIMEAYQRRMGMDVIEPVYRKKAKQYMDEFVCVGHKHLLPHIYFNDQIVVFPSIGPVGKNNVAHEAAHAIYRKEGIIDPKTSGFDQEMFATFGSDFMLRREGMKLSDIIDGEMEGDDKRLARVLWKSYDSIESRFDSFEDFIKHMGDFFNGRKSFEDFRMDEGDHKPYN